MRVLVVTGDSIYSDKPNAQCVRAIVEGLTSSGASVEVITTSSCENKNLSNIISSAFHVIQRIYYWPVTNTKALIKCRNEVIEKLQYENYDAILAVHKPYDALYSAYKGKLKYYDIPLIVYEIDPMTNDIDRRLGKGRHLFFLTRHMEKKIFKAADCVIHMRCNQKKFESAEYERFQSKFVYYDFPLIRKCAHVETEGKVYSGERVSLVYSGMIDSVYRSPQYILDVLQKASECITLKADFFSKGNCESMVAEYAQRNDSIIENGYVSKNVLDSVISNADCLINISNKYSEMLPSKLLSYMMTGKPIIHISSQNNDSCICYLDGYPLSVVLYESDPIEVSVLKFIAFIKTTYGKRLSGDYVYNQFIENTPEYSVEQLINTVSKLRCEK